MPTKYSDTKVGRFTFVAADNQLHEFNLERYRKVIETRDFGSVGKTFWLPALMWKAIENPRVPQYQYMEEYYNETCGHGYEYETVAIFNPDTFMLQTNRLTCPYRDYHHLGTTCPVCGMEG